MADGQNAAAKNPPEGPDPSALAEEIEALRAWAADLEGQRDRLQALVEDLESDLSAVQQELHHLRQERADEGGKSEESAGGSDRELANLRVRYKALADQLHQARSGREDLEARVGQLESELAESNAARDRLSQSLASAQEQARAYERTVDRLRQRNRELEGKKG